MRPLGQARVEDHGVRLGDEKPGRIAGLVALDLPGRRVGGLPGIAEDAQRRPVDDGTVVEMQDEDRRVGRDQVDLLQGRHALFGELELRKDWGTGQPVVFSHGWPLTADAWEDQMFFLASHGYRCIAHDRRGHGRSSQPWNGNDMDTYADDLAALIETLDLKDAIHVGHSTGGGEVARYIGRHGTKRVAKAVLIGAVPPLMLKTRGQSRRPADRECSTTSAPPCSPIARSSSRISGCRSTDPTGRREGLAGPTRLVLAAGHAGRPQGRLRLHQGLLGDGLHRGSQEVRRADADHSRRRRSDRADRQDSGVAVRRSW